MVVVHTATRAVTVDREADDAPDSHPSIAAAIHKVDGAEVRQWLDNVVIA